MPTEQRTAAVRLTVVSAETRVCSVDTAIATELDTKDSAGAREKSTSVGDWLFAAVVATTPFMFYTNATSLHLAVSDIFLPLAAVAVLFGILTRGALKISPVALLLATGAGLLVCGNAFIFTVQSPQFEFQYAASTALKLVVSAIYFILAHLYATASRLSTILFQMRVWIYVACCNAAGSVLWAITGVGIVPHDQLRSLGFFQDPNIYAGYLVVSMGLALTQRRRWGTVRICVVVALLVAGLVSTGSRGGLITFSVVLVATLIWFSRRRVAMIFRVVLTVFGLGFSYLIVTAAPVISGLAPIRRISTSFAAADADPRLQLWKIAAQLFSAHPFAGIGGGQFPLYSGSVRILGKGVGYDTHNSFLKFFVEFGIIGGIAFFLLIARAIMIAARGYRGSLDLTIGLFCGVVAIAMSMLSVEFQNLRFVWIVVGFAVGLSSSRGPLQLGSESRDNSDLAPRSDPVGARRRARD